MRFETLAQWLAWQETLHPRPIDLGLERVTRVAKRLDLQQPHCPVITVAGTNGKGSTVAMLDSVYRAAGYHTGAFTSPHILRYNERIRVDGVTVGDQPLCRAFEQVDAARREDTLSYFEFGALAALWLFREADAEVIILEVGLGGRLDAVNIVDPDVAIVTAVGLDHQQWLGDDRERIGAEKAGIFRAGRPAVCGDRDPPASVREAALRLGARWLAAGEAFDRERKGDAWNWYAPDGQVWADLPLPALAGMMQLDNAACVLTAVQQLLPRLPVERDAVKRGLSGARLAGRFQQIRSDPVVIVDVAHNPLGAAALADVLSRRPVPGRTFAVLGMMADKDLDGVIAALRDQVDRWFGGGLPGVPRAASAEVLCGRLRAVAGAGAECHDDIADALESACSVAGSGDRVVVLGSFHTIARVIRPGDIP